MAKNIKPSLRITGFTPAENRIISNAVEIAYDGSDLFRSDADYWLDAGHKIWIIFEPNVMYVPRVGDHPGNVVKADLNFVMDLSYISDYGRATQYTPLGVLVHELSHVFTKSKDLHDGAEPLPDLKSEDFKGSNVTHVNDIWKQLNLPSEVSYVAQSWAIGKPVPGGGIGLHISGYDYTDGAAITGAVTSDSALISTLATDDLLIGGSSANTFRAGGGADFMLGAGGDDELDGGDGIDTVIYFGNATDFDVRLNSDRTSWTVRHARGEKDQGTDILRNIELLRFDEGVHKTKYKLEVGGLTFEEDVALVFDMSDNPESITNRVKALAGALVDELFSNDKRDVRLGVCGYEDAQQGASVISPFSDEGEMAARKSAALSAIARVTAGPAGGPPEPDLDGLLRTINSGMGEWRLGAGVHKIVLFTHAPATSGAFVGLVETVAHEIGATVTAHASASPETMGLGFALSRDIFDLAHASDAPPEHAGFWPIDVMSAPDTSTTQLEIYTIFPEIDGVTPAEAHGHVLLA